MSDCADFWTAIRINCQDYRRLLYHYYTMIARDFKGNGFKGILDYLLDSSNRNGKIVSVVSFEGIDVPIATDSRDVFDPSRIAGSFRAQSSLRPRVGKPVRHIVLSCMDYDRARIGQISF